MPKGKHLKKRRVDEKTRRASKESNVTRNKWFDSLFASGKGRSPVCFFSSTISFSFSTHYFSLTPQRNPRSVNEKKVCVEKTSMENQSGNLMDVRVAPALSLVWGAGWTSISFSTGFPAELIFSLPGHCLFPLLPFFPCLGEGKRTARKKEKTSAPRH